MSYNILIGIDKKVKNINPLKFKILQLFTLYCLKTLNINEENIKLYLLPINNNQNMTTGGFNPNTKEICIRAEERSLPDILRTIAHEFTHYKQLLNGDIEKTIEEKGEIPDIGGKIEDQANLMSGRLVKLFVKKFDCRFIHFI